MTLRSFTRDRRAVAAVEFAILAPVAIWMIGGGLNLYFQGAQKAAVSYVSGAAASIGGRALRSGCTAATQAATAAFEANRGLFFGGMAPALNAVACVDASGNPADDSAAVAVSVTITSTMPVPFPVLWPGGPTVTATLTAEG